MRKLFVLFFFSLVLVSLNAFSTEQRLISVVGTAEKSFQPDIVYINISIWGKGDSAKKAQANNQSEYEVLKKSLDTFKVKKEDAKTTSYNLNPEYSYDQKTN
ncbi:MAG: SIMPL domain-containing protein, partial [Bdellovibrionales bacterium]|nr:SIMPL domain-containing protein [Bdellovibrionales bacterium]